MKFKKKLIRLSAIFSALVMLLSAAGCSNGATDVTVLKNIAALNIVPYETRLPQLHTSSVEQADVLAGESGYIKLYVDETTCSFIVHETVSNIYWNALPDSLAEMTGPQSNAGVVRLEVLGGSDIFYLNSQDNSVAYNTASYELVENGVKFIYDIFLNEDTAKKETLTKDDIAFRLSVTVTLVDGSMVVKCSHENLSGNENALIRNIDLLNYFGAFSNSAVDDFLFVPDGCGAIIKTAIEDDSFEPLEFKVYGADAAVSDKKMNPAVVGAFGMKHLSSAFVAIIEKGDAVATVKANKAVMGDLYNRVYASFEVTPVLYEDEKLFISDTPYSDEISMIYRFVSGSNATYAGLASACREQLIRNGTLSTGNVVAADYLPFNLTVVGVANKELINFGDFSISLPATLTDFDQARDMLSHMKSKGINNINLRYVGAFSGGMNSKDITESKLLSRLGGDSALRELYEYVSSQNLGLFLDVNLLSYNRNSGKNSAASTIRDEKISVNMTNNLKKHLGGGDFERSVRTTSAVRKIVSTVLSATRYYSFTGYCLNDIGSLLYSDFSADSANRETVAKQLIAPNILPLSTGKRTMTVNGNFYMLKNIDVIVNIPLKTSVAQSGAYLSVPFVQLILHGMVDYSGLPINTDNDYEELLLKYIEFGACPSFEWEYETIDENAENDVFYYDNWLNIAVEYYTKANEALGDLRDARITDHYEIDDGVFCTEYDTGSVIYVNYTDEDYATMGAVVGARDFIRIN